MAEQARSRRERIVVLGTAKGVFLLRSQPDRAADRAAFDLTGPYIEGEQAYSVAIDRRAGRERVLVGSTSEHWGTVVRASDDLGATWDEPVVGNIAFPPGTDAATVHVWQLHPAGDDEPDVVYAGVEPAALFRSDDAGATFSLVRSLWDHPDRPLWEAGFGGQCLHSIVVQRDDPRRVLVAISAGGVYRTDDGGEKWQAAVDGIRYWNPPEASDIARCVHRTARDATRPGTVFLQGHWGTYRTDDFGDSWTEITNGLPSDFGFSMVAHPRRSGVAYVIPLASDEVRWMPDGAARVFRTEDDGGSWTVLSCGLPGRDAYLTVLRDAFCSDDGDPLGLYFGTRSGEVFASADEGESWHCIASRLPAILSVRAATVT